MGTSTFDKAAYQRAYYKKNKERLCAASRAYHHAHRDQQVAKMRTRSAEQRKRYLKSAQPGRQARRLLVLADFQQRMRTHKAQLAALKAKPCRDCGNEFPSVCMEFDHVKPGKRYNLSQMSNHSRAAVLEELARCEVVCCNCHRVRSKARKPTIHHSVRYGAYSESKYIAFRGWLATAKASPCADCGNCFPAPAMDFDHVRGEKLMEVGGMWSWSRAKVLAEIAKCDLVCACCHRLRTEGRRTQKAA